MSLDMCLDMCMGMCRAPLGHLSPSHSIFFPVVMQVLGNRHPDTLKYLGSLGAVLKDQGKLDAAEPLVREALTTSRQVANTECNKKSLNLTI